MDGDRVGERNEHKFEVEVGVVASNEYELKTPKRPSRIYSSACSMCYGD